MPAWYEHAYSGAPMVPLPGFPRPLYPPDAAARGKTPSVDGPDVVAYKRTVSRLGRWPWQSFDDSYSNGFSHGSSGNVGESGVAGFQRQQSIEASGWLGKSTFNALRSALVPLELPHGGEHGLDAVAADLLREAWEMFGGAEPAPTGTVRAVALARAVGELGTTESPSGSNLNPYGAWYGVNGEPWCAMFVTWSFETGAASIGKDSPSFVRGSRYAYCPYIVADARAGRYGLRTVEASDVIPGDVVVYDWSGGADGVYDHVGIFEKWVDVGSTFYAIEGNTSATDNSNGGAVQRRTRAVGGGVVFVRVAEP
jgi:hypothetical protein